MKHQVVLLNNDDLFVRFSQAIVDGSYLRESIRTRAKTLADLFPAESDQRNYVRSESQIKYLTRGSQVFDANYANKRSPRQMQFSFKCTVYSAVSAGSIYQKEIIRELERTERQIPLGTWFFRIRFFDSNLVDICAFYFDFFIIFLTKFHFPISH